ncbi:MAG: asparagine synthase (glutamine-hydrolyzing) [Dehalococcoidia bacterium]
MCGICGQFIFNGIAPSDIAATSNMCSVLKHRGPDDEGFYNDGFISLGHRRLSIIDIEGGHQPISNEDGTVWVITNGEIYNFKELRNALEKSGHVFSSRSDSEVLVHLYEEQGRALVKELRGMFAFAIWDSRNKTLLLGRDRLGKKPLFYAYNQERFLFASELKALLQEPSIKHEVNLTSLHHFLTLQWVPGPQTIIQGVNQLQAGHTLVCSNGQVKIERYWEPEFLPKNKLSKDEALEATQSLLEEAVKLRLVSDVPLGAFLSGGLDSSLIVALMARATDKKVKTFSVGFTEEAFSELEHARAVAKYFDTEHEEIFVKPDIIALLPKLIWHLDQPLADPAAIPTYYLSESTRRHVTVALNGDGGDETFAGYQRYFADGIADAYAVVPAAVRNKLILPVLRRFTGVSDKPVDTDVWGAVIRMHQAADIAQEASIIRWGSYFNSDMKDDIYSDELRNTLRNTDSVELLRETFRRAENHADNRLDKTLYVDMMNYLPDDLLVKIDRMCMANSLEGRSPFLDQKFVEFACRMPIEFKDKRTTTKYLLRELAKKIIPQDIAARRKHGFSVPIGSWIRSELRDMTYETLLSPQALSRGYFKQQALENLLDEHCAKKADHGKRIWALLCLELWHQVVIDYTKIPMS